MVLYLNTTGQGWTGRDNLSRPKERSRAGRKKPESIPYNCTIRVPKQLVSPMFDDKAERFKRVAEMLAEAALRMERRNVRKNKIVKLCPINRTRHHTTLYVIKS